jgi:hypothetical protein
MGRWFCNSGESISTGQRPSQGRPSFNLLPSPGLLFIYSMNFISFLAYFLTMC